MAFFSDVFYPGNPQRRQQVEDLKSEGRIAFLSFKTQWNQFTQELNSALSQADPKYGTYQITPVTYDEDADDTQTMINQINSVLQSADSQIQELRTALKADVTGFEQLEIDLQNGTATVKNVADLLVEVGETVFGGFVAYYTYNGIRLFVTLLNMADAGISALTEILAGVMGGMILGAAAVLITDAIISAIEGAIERKQLNEAIEALQEFKTQVTDPLSNTASQVGAQYIAMSQGLYRLNDTLLLVREGDQWQVISTGSSDTAHAVVHPSSGSIQLFGSEKAA
ncbi:hypothetical protein BB779_04030 [Pseudomonas viridiflava]|uniref:hypothetical protein n=1 Tax=Pseudomonas viridiflava TaxID=33069 RepID=UPI00083FC4DD|nr:hypothetical protein [Pseudomonas viridiflava]ODJ92247.1 hypothetical protein BB779_04030 [Pseudomonas viridiflava]